MTAPLITPTATQINRPITSHAISIHSGSALEPHLSAGGVAHLELSITSRFVTLPAEVLHRQAKGCHTHTAPILSWRERRRVIQPRRLARRTGIEAPKADQTLVELARLRKSDKRMKAEVRRRAEALKDTKAELQEMRHRLADAEQILEERSQRLEASLAEAERYQRWWFNEYCFVQVLLQAVPDRREFDAIAEASSSRHYTYLTEA